MPPLTALRRLVQASFLTAVCTCLYPEARGEPLPASLVLQDLPARSIGPANMSGRIVDVAVVESRPSTLYVASASGGLWKTVNNGTTWNPVFDEQATLSLGAVAICQAQPHVVWVGTGEGNPRNSVASGNGVYRSTNGGKSWQHVGLADTHHIGRIVAHPTNPDVAYVAALGHLWGPNTERGLFKTGDGGQSWRRVKFVDEDTGFIDVAIDPVDSQTIYAAAWQVRRDGFSGGNPAVQTGPGSGLYRSGDGGRSWQRMTLGLPTRPLGRCGFSIFRKDPRIVYAVVQTDRTAVTTIGQLPNLKETPTPAKDKKGKPVNRTLTPEDGGIFRSDDKGQTWKYLNSLVPRPFYYGQLRVDPVDPNRLFVLGVLLYKSRDGGKTFLPGNAAAGVHSDHHALWIDPRDSDHLILGCDGGLNFSYDGGTTWEHLKNLPVSQFYAVALDTRRPYRVYGGLQDNGSWGGPSATRDLAGITFADWVNVLGADGFYCQVDPAEPDTVYAEAQYGRLHRLDLRTGRDKSITPRLGNKAQPANLRPPPEKGAPAFRFNWNSPLLLSPHDGRTLWYGGNHVFRSTDRGDTWTVASPDLTRGKPGPSENTGHTITTLTESRLRRGLVYAGTDDGRLHVSPDAGLSWHDLSDKLPGVPADRWISRVVCSAFREGTAYVTVDRHRNDDRRPHVFKTIDNGQTWKPLGDGLPATAPVHVLREDPRNPDVLYLGTDVGLFLSLDGGASWAPYRNGLPAVAVHDLAVQAHAGELVVASHGRGIYIVDVWPLGAWTPRVRGAAAFLFELRPAVRSPRRLFRSWGGARMFAGQNPPYGAVLYYYLKDAANEPVRLAVKDAGGTPVTQLKLSAADQKAGLHRVVWDLIPAAPAKTPGAAPRVAAGEYSVTLQAGGQSWTRPLEVLSE